MNEIKAFVHHDEAGRIHRVSHLQASVGERVVRDSPHRVMVLGVGDVPGDPFACYLDGNLEFAERQPMAPWHAISEGELVLLNLPDPCDVRVLGENETVVGGSLTIEFDEPGTYRISIENAVAYLDHTLEVKIP